MKEHVCRKARYCICSIIASEPSDECPVHGVPWPPRCSICGRFMPWPSPREEAKHIVEVVFDDGRPSLLQSNYKGNLWVLVILSIKAHPDGMKHVRFIKDETPEGQDILRSQQTKE